MGTVSERGADGSRAPTSEAPHAADTSAHLPALDGVRGVAVLAVLAYHLSFFGRLPALAGDTPALKPLVTAAMAGWTGVDLFFVLSGFLITRILLETRGRRTYYRTFVVRRVLRIFPAYFLALAVLYGWMLPSFPAMPAGEAGSGWWLASYLANFRVALDGWETLPLPLQHCWSLAIEEQYYLFWPLLVVWLPPRLGVRFCALLCGFSLAVRVGLVIADEPLAAYVSTPARLDGLAAGSLLAYLARDGRLPGARLRAALAAGSALGLLAIIALTGRLSYEEPLYTPSLGFSLVALGCVALVASCVAAPGGRLARALSGRSLRFVGRYSYGIYIWHQPMILLMVALRWPARLLPGAPSAGLHFAAWCLLGSALVMSAALLSYHGVERRFLGLKDRWAPREAR